MLSLSIFNECEPDADDVEKYGIYASNIQFLKTSDAIKWYDAQKNFETLTFKITYLSGGEITAISKDASTLFPINMLVMEVESLPDNCTPENITNGDWKVEEGQIVYYPKTDEVTSE